MGCTRVTLFFLRWCGRCDDHRAHIASLRAFCFCQSLACPIFFGLAYFVELRENTVPLTRYLASLISGCAVLWLENVLCRTHIFWAIAAGTCLFTNQLFYVTGVKLANSVLGDVGMVFDTIITSKRPVQWLGAAWQPSQPIFVMLVSSTQIL